MPVRCPPLIAGEKAEGAFMCRALEYGIIVSKPFGNSAPYDFIVQPRTQRSQVACGKLWRIQVKSSFFDSPCIRAHGYRVTTAHHNGQKYRSSEVDFFAIWVVAQDTWYIIPRRKLGAAQISLFPHVQISGGKYERFREAWHLLR